MKKTCDGACHCGKVRFEVTADIDHVRVCDCSICRVRGALIHRVPAEGVKIHTPLSELTLYQWGSYTGRDYFCPMCGLLPFRRTSMPTQDEVDTGSVPFDGWAVNTRCLKDFDIFDAPQKRIYRSQPDVADILPDTRNIQVSRANFLRPAGTGSSDYASLRIREAQVLIES